MKKNLMLLLSVVSMVFLFTACAPSGPAETESSVAVAPPVSEPAPVEKPAEEPEPVLPGFQISGEYDDKDGAFFTLTIDNGYDWDGQTNDVKEKLIRKILDNALEQAKINDKADVIRAGFSGEATVSDGGTAFTFDTEEDSDDITAVLYTKGASTSNYTYKDALKQLS
jgi:hypothetical protein